MFKPGDSVTVRDLPIEGHMRTPHYARGAHGVIERYCGSFQNPEKLGHGIRPAPKVDLYRVRFFQRDLWPNYAGHGSDTVDVEIYAHWLKPHKDIEERPAP